MRDLAAAIQDAWDFSDPAGSEARFAAMLAEAKRADHEPAAAEIRTQIARAMGLQRRFVEATDILDGVAEWNSEALHWSERVFILCRLEQGRIDRSSGNAAAALSSFVVAWNRAGEGEVREYQALAVDAAHMCAIADPAHADDWNSKALAIAEASADPDVRRWRASLLNNMGWTRVEAKDYTAALDLFERALAARVEQRTTGKFRGPWLVARWCVAKTKRVLGRVEEALAEQQQLAAAHAAAGTSDGFVSEEIAECLLALGRGTESRPFFAAAHLQLAADRWLSANEPARIERLKKLGEGAA